MILIHDSTWANVMNFVKYSIEITVNVRLVFCHYIG